MNQIGGKLPEVTIGSILQSSDYILAEIGGKIYRIPASVLFHDNNFITKATPATVPDTSKTGNWYFASEDGDYPNFGLTGVISGGRIVYDGTNWLFIRSGFDKPVFTSSATELYIYYDKNNVALLTPSANPNIRLFSVTDGAHGEIYIIPSVNITSHWFGFHNAPDESEGHIDTQIISKIKAIDYRAGKMTKVTYHRLGDIVYLMYEHDDYFEITDTDPTTLGSPAAGKTFAGTLNNKPWTKDSAGNIIYIYDELFALGY